MIILFFFFFFFFFFNKYILLIINILIKISNIYLNIMIIMNLKKTVFHKISNWSSSVYSQWNHIISM